VNWQAVYKDHVAFPPDVEFHVSNDLNPIPQKFFGHKMLMSVVSHVFKTMFNEHNAIAGSTGGNLVLVFSDCDPEAFSKGRVKKNLKKGIFHF
jgi:hypothetical protein